MNENLINIINSISQKVDKGTEDVKEMASIVTEIINDRDQKLAELAHELTEAYAELDRLEEENDIMRSDLTVILDYLKKNKIDMTYVVKFRPKENDAK
jgi:outer membrane murein-binding lipoprotein Lpp